MASSCGLRLETGIGNIGHFDEIFHISRKVEVSFQVRLFFTSTYKMIKWGCKSAVTH